ncbi:MAG: RIO kinase 1 [Myxococcota bacterium]|jgi:RIO kinase 1
MSKRSSSKESGDYRLKSRDRKSRRTPSKTDKEPTASAAWITTYQPSRHEASWLASSLGLFQEMGLITDVLFFIQGGKEASVYCCATPTGELLAAKVYRPRKFRQLRNDKLYRLGRETLVEGGASVKKTEHRIMRAINKRTAFGEQIRHTSWLMHEYTTLERLVEAGAAVPKPHASSDNAILMDYIGDTELAAPPLTRLELSAEEAPGILAVIVKNIEIMLSIGMVHGDLSAYNILYDHGVVTIIDFPQVTEVGVNPFVRDLFWRDVTRVCEYFAALGVPCDADALATEIWDRHVVTVEEDVPDDDPGEEEHMW